MTKSNRYEVFVESSAVESRINGIAPMGFGFIIFGEGIEAVPHCGYGAEKDTQAMLAHGLQIAADEIFMAQVEPIITVIKPGVGTQKFLTDFVPIWRKKIAEGAQGFSKHSQDVWERLYLLSLLGKQAMRKPEGIDEDNSVRLMKKLAKESANNALGHRQKNKARYRTCGVFVVDDVELSQLDAGPA